MTLALFLGGLILMVGALVQGTVGYGMNLVAAPALALIDPELVPVPLLLVSSTHALLTAARESSHTDWPGVGWTMLGRVPGTVLGVLAVALLPQGPFSLVVGLSVLLCVGLSLISWRPRPTPRALVIAGVAGGTFGTAATIGGPPVALVYQHADGPTLRATMAAYFALGSIFSVVALAVGGQVHAEPLVKAAQLLPFLIAGFALSGPLRRYLDAGWTRTAVLVVAAASACALIVRGLLA